MGYKLIIRCNSFDGLFVQVAVEKLKIRDNFGARSSALLQKVFGYPDKKKI